MHDADIIDRISALNAGHRGALDCLDPPVGFREIRLHSEVDSDDSDEQLATLLRLTER